MKIHYCTDDDWADFFKFSTYDDGAIKGINYLNNNMAFYCFDKDQLMEIRGKNAFNSVSINIDMMSCDATDTTNLCAFKNKTEFEDYLGHPELIILHN